MQDRLVAIAVAEDDVSGRNHSVPDDLVCSRRAADDEEGVVRAEDASGVALPGRDGPGVIEQRAERPHRARDVRTNGVLAEKIIEELPARALAKGTPPAVSRRVPRVAGTTRVLHQRTEHRRGQPFNV